MQIFIILYLYICLKCTQIAEISVSYRKSELRSTTVMSDFRPQNGNIALLRIHDENMLYNPYLMTESLKFPRFIGNRDWGTPW